MIRKKHLLSIIIIFLISILVLLIFYVLCLKNLKSSNITLEKIKEMTLDEKLGQLIIAGINGYTSDENTTKLLKKYMIGGFILYEIM